MDEDSLSHTSKRGFGSVFKRKVISTSMSSTILNISVVEEFLPYKVNRYKLIIVTTFIR